MRARDALSIDEKCFRRSQPNSRPLMSLRIFEEELFEVILITYAKHKQSRSSAQSCEYYLGSVLSKDQRYVTKYRIENED